MVNDQIERVSSMDLNTIVGAMKTLKPFNVEYSHAIKGRALVILYRGQGLKAVKHTYDPDEPY